jgi:transcriptional regulator with XRE-family HTH domain
MGHALRMARLNKGMSMEEAARALNERPGLDLQRKPTAVGHYESGRRPVPSELVAFFADLYDVPLASLFPDGDKVVDRLTDELRRTKLALGRERAMVTLSTRWMALAKSTNPELAHLDTKVMEDDWEDYGKGGGPVTDPDQLPLPLEDQ